MEGLTKDKISERPTTGFTVLEVVIALFIFGCVSASLFRLIMQTDQIRGRALYLDNCTRLAAGEAERLRSIATQNTPVEDSLYSVTTAGRTFTVNRQVIETDVPPSFIAGPRKPVAVELLITDENNSRFSPLSFKLLLGQENP